jgi:beta-lactamase regulating signal transducer with metallopeptidase domain
MLASHIPALGFVASAVLRIFAAYLLAYAVTRLTPRAAVRHAVWLVFLGCISLYWIGVLRDSVLSLPASGKNSWVFIGDSAVRATAPAAKTLHVPIAWQSSVTEALPILLGLYLVAVSVLVGRLVCRRRKLREAISEACVPSEELTEVFATECERLGVANCEILELHGWSSPGTAYIRNPVVILPDGVEESLDREQLIDILYHELVHVLRRDFLWSTFADVASCLLCFHPAAWLASRELARERELACDTAVMQLREGRREGYALCLTQMARQQSLRTRTSPRGSVALLNSFLATRVKTLLAGETPGRGNANRVLSGVAGIGAFVLFIVGWPALSLSVVSASGVNALAAPMLLATTALPVRSRTAAPATHRPESASAKSAPLQATVPLSDVLTDNTIEPESHFVRYSPIDPTMDGNSDADSATKGDQDSSRLTAGNGSGFNNPQSAPAWQRASSGTPINTGVHGTPGHRAHVSAAAGSIPRPF